MDTTPILLDYHRITAEVETVIMRHGLTGHFGVCLYPPSRWRTIRASVLVYPDEFIARVTGYESRVEGAVLTRWFDDGIVRIECSAFVPVPA